MDQSCAKSATVALERCMSYEPLAVRGAIDAAVQACGSWAHAGIKPGDRVLVKPNCICGAEPARPAQTHPAVIIETCRSLKDYGARPVVGDSPAWGSLKGNLKRLGALSDLQAMDVEIIEFKNPTRVENPRGKVFRELVVDRAALDADAIVNLPKFKAHCQLVLTVALKNMFGCVGGRRKSWWHLKAGSYENYFGLMLVETYELLRPAISIIDAVTAMQGQGPIRGQARQMNLVLASRDGAALERIAAEIVGIKPAQIRTLAAARTLEVGTPYLDQIETVGVPVEEAKIEDFKLPRMMPIGFSLPRLVKGAFKNAWIVRQQKRQDRQQLPTS